MENREEEKYEVEGEGRRRKIREKMIIKEN
jgi:hypothetical protein